MKRIILVMAFALVLVFPLTAGEKSAAELEKDKAAIKQAALDYFLGYYEGSAEREERAMHPELVKRGYRTLPTGKTVLAGIGKSAMVEYSRAGFGKKQAADKGEIKIKVFDVFRKTASALVVSNHYHDYIHLVKTDDGKWQIVNVLWEPTKLPKRQKPKKEEKKK